MDNTAMSLDDEALAANVVKTAGCPAKRYW